MSKQQTHGHRDVSPKPFLIFFLLLLITFVMLITSHSAMASERCAGRSQGLAEDFREDFDDLLTSYDEDIEDLKQDYMEKISGSTAAEFGIIHQKARDANKIDSGVMPVYDLVYNAIMDSVKKKDDNRYCHKFTQLKNIAKNRTKTVEKLLEKTISDIEQRIDLEDLDSDEGLAFFTIHLGGYAEVITVVSSGHTHPDIELGPFVDNQLVELRKVERGRYAFDKVEWAGMKGNSVITNYYDFSDEKYEFNISPGVINFTGVFEFNRVNGRGYSDYSDKTSILIQVLQDRYPLIAKKYGWYNSVQPKDPYIDFYRAQVKEKEAASE